MIYTKTRVRERRTITDHLYSFRRYAPNNEYLYLNLSAPNKLTESIVNTSFDAVIFHYTFLSNRFDGMKWKEKYALMRDAISRLSGIKVLIPHDEYVYTEDIWQIAKDCNASIIYASCFPHDYDILYPKEKLGEHTRCKTVFTGYVEEKLLPSLKRKVVPICNRKKDLGYRALESTYMFGSHGQIKSQLAIEFMELLEKHPEISSDILLTYRGGVNTLYGNKWFKFLMSCKASLGCLGGSSLMDADGSLKAKIDNHIKTHPDASFEEVRNACYSNKDGQIQTFLLGPRHFENAMTKTCQCLVEGDYHGVLFPNEHYIEIKKDFSNIEDVLEKIKDTSACQEMVERCYKKVVLSGNYSYRKFATDIINDLKTERLQQTDSEQEKLPFWVLRVSTSFSNIYSPIKAIKDILYRQYQWLHTYYPKLYQPLEKIVRTVFRRNRW